MYKLHNRKPPICCNYIMHATVSERGVTALFWCCRKCGDEVEDIEADDIKLTKSLLMLDRYFEKTNKSEIERTLKKIDDLEIDGESLF